MESPLLTPLYAMRLLLDSVIANVEQAAPVVLKVETGECPHPEERQVNATVMGGPPEVICLVCGQQRLGTAS